MDLYAPTHIGRSNYKWWKVEETKGEILNLKTLKENFIRDFFSEPANEYIKIKVQHIKNFNEKLSNANDKGTFKFNVGLRWTSKTIMGK